MAKSTCARPLVGHCSQKWLIDMRRTYYHTNQDREDCPKSRRTQIMHHVWSSMKGFISIQAITEHYKRQNSNYSHYSSEHAAEKDGELVLSEYFKIACILCFWYLYYPLSKGNSSQMP